MLKDLPAPIAGLINAAGLTPGLLVEHLGVSASTEDVMIARTLGLQPEMLPQLRAELREANQARIESLLENPDVSTALENVPFTRGQRVVVIGDSLSMAANSWANLLGQLLAPLGIELINRAVSGRTTTETIPRLAQSLALQPDWTIIMIGANDVRRELTAAGSIRMLTLGETIRNQFELHQAASQVSSVLTMPSTLPIDDARSDVNRQRGYFWNDREVAEANRAILDAVPNAIDLRSAVEPFDGYWSPDGVHPTSDGQAHILAKTLLLLAAH